MLLSCIIPGYTAKKLSAIQKEVMSRTDARVQKVTEGKCDAFGRPLKAVTSLTGLLSITSHTHGEALRLGAQGRRLARGET